MKSLPLPRSPVTYLRYATMLLGCTLACLFSLPAVAAYKVDVDAPGPIRDLLTRYLDLVRYQSREDLDPDQLNFLLATAADQVRELVATEGYFSPTTTVRIDRQPEVPVVHVAVEPGPRTTVAKVDLQVTGAAATQSPQQVEQVRRRWSLRAGEPFRQQEWNDAKQTGLRILQDKRYPAARIAESEAAIHPERQAADLAVSYDSGPLFSLGELNISGTHRYPEQIIRNVNPLQVGEEYDVDRLLELQREIQRTPYYSNVVIDVDKDPAHAELAPVNVRVTEFPQQRIRGAVGYATDTGARIEGRYSHYNVFDHAWVLDSQLRFEQQRQIGSISLAMPPSRANFINSVQGSLERTTLVGVDLRSRRLGIQRQRKTDKYDYGYSIEHYSDRLQQLSGAALPTDIVTPPGAHQALVAGYNRTYRDVDDQVFPRRGHVIAVQAGAALKGLLTDQTFFRAYSRMRHYQPVGRLDLVVLRAELGAVITKGGNAAVPASLLFRAGGTESVRGYDYQSIGDVRDGTVFPTRYIATGGLEYQHWFNRTWGGAVFYDVGTATDRWSGKQLFHAVGVGVRWRSPVGPVNLDIGYGFENHTLRPHLSLGVAF